MEDEKDKKEDVKDQEKEKNHDSSKLTSDDYKNLFGTPGNQ